jgi:hypothetical protein
MEVLVRFKILLYECAREIAMGSLLRLFFLCPLFLFGTISNELNQGLRALQQIRNLIPERFSEEEFDILVDEKGLQKSLSELCCHHQKRTEVLPNCMLGSSSYYLSRWTLSGEPVRILDSYFEFQYGPFWKYPAALEHLEEMELGPYRMDR